MTYGNLLTSTGEGPITLQRSMPARTLVFCLLVALFAWSRPAAAAAPPSQKLLRKVAIGSQIQVVTNDGQVLEGKVVANSPSSINVLETGREQAVTVDHGSVAGLSKTGARVRGKRSGLVTAIWAGVFLAGTGILIATAGSIL